MEKMFANQNTEADFANAEPGNTDNASEITTDSGEEAPALAEGEIPCPSCGKGNVQGSYTCQHCGANLFE